MRILNSVRSHEFTNYNISKCLTIYILSVLLSSVTVDEISLVFDIV